MLDPTPQAQTALTRAEGPYLDKGASNLPGDSLRRTVKDCKARVRVFAHPGPAGGHRWAVPFDACHEANCECPACVNKATKKRSGRISGLYRRIRARSGLKMGMLAIVLTIPPEVQTDDPKALAGIRKAGREVLRAWVSALNGLGHEHRRAGGWSLAGVDVLHPAGDETPEKFKPHIHAELPAVAWWKPAGELDDRPAWKALRYKVTPDELFWLRVLWGMALMQFGWKPRINMHGVPMVDRCDVHYHWFSGGDSPKARAELQHRIRYDFRHWPSWEGKFRKVQWWGYAAPARQPKAGIEKTDEKKPEENDEGDPCLCPKCGQAAEWNADIGRNTEKLRRRKTREKVFDLVGAPSWAKSTKHVYWYDPTPIKLSVFWRH